MSNIKVLTPTLLNSCSAKRYPFEPVILTVTGVAADSVIVYVKSKNPPTEPKGLISLPEFNVKSLIKLLVVVNTAPVVKALLTLPAALWSNIYIFLKSKELKKSLLNVRLYFNSIASIIFLILRAGFKSV